MDSLTFDAAKIKRYFDDVPGVNFLWGGPGHNTLIDTALLDAVTPQLPNNNPGAPEPGKLRMRFDDAKG